MNDHEPSTREQIDAFLQKAGYDPLTARMTMERLADAIISRAHNARIDAWLDSLRDEPLTPEKVEDIVDYVKKRVQHDKEAP